MTPGSLSALLAAILLTAALGGCATVAVSPATGQPTAAPRPAYQVGQRWVRTDGVWELTYVGEEVYVFNDAHTSEIVLSHDLLPVRFIDRRPLTRRPGQANNEPFSFHPAPRLDWPLAVGKRGASKGSWGYFYDEVIHLPSPYNPTVVYARTLTFSTRVDATFAWSIEAYEQVRVPAGTFDAYRLHFTITADDPKAEHAPTWRMRTWYAPAIRQFVAADGTNIGDLLAFRLASVDRGGPEPVTVVLREPEEGAESPKPDLLVSGRAAADQGIVQLTVSVNGREIVRQEPRGVPLELTLESTVTLRDGRNVVIVTATDAAGRSRQEARTVFYDPARQSAAVERAQARTASARQAAERSGAMLLAREAWSVAEHARRRAEAAVAGRDYGQALDAFDAAAAGYERAARAAAALNRLAEERSAAQQGREAAKRSRAAAQAADAARWAAAAWRDAGATEAEANRLASGEDFERAIAAYGRAEVAYRAAEQQALAQALAAAAERKRQELSSKQRDSTERQARAAADARREAAAAGAETHAAPAFARAREKENAAAAALAAGDFVEAQDRYGAAQAAYREAATVARAQAERLARLERERAQAEQALAAAAQARRAAEQVGAARYAAGAAAVAAAREGEAVAAARGGDYQQAARAGDVALQAWERAAAAARAAAAVPMRFAFDAPGQVEEPVLRLAGQVVSGRGVARVFVTLNGTTVWRRDEPSAAADLPVQLLLTLHEGHNTIVLTAADADGRIEQAVRVVRFEPPLPLALDVRYPPNGERVSQAASVVAAVAASSRGVTEVRVTLNGQEVHRQAERQPQRSVVAAVPVTLSPGANTVVVTAVEKGGATRHETRAVTLEAAVGGQAQPATGGAAAGEPRRWAVVIGVGAYDDPGVPRLGFTVPDAEAVYRTLIEQGGFKKENVLLLTDRTDRKPTLRTIKWALGTFLARAAMKNDTVVIFFAGHGAPEADVLGRERDGVAKYLVPMDGDPDDLYASGLPMDEFATIFGRIEAERVIIFLDTCYSGAAGGRTFASRRTRSVNLDDGFLQRLVHSRGRVIVTAARTNEVSVEVSQLGHGLFTYYLIRGLRGAADSNADKVVTLQELYEYVAREVTRHSRAIGANQHPTMRGELEGALPLTEVAR